MIVAVPPKHNTTYGGAVVNVYHANKGQGLPKHEHTFSHATFCCAGSLWVRIEGKEIVYHH